jgi:hypothetical protein
MITGRKTPLGWTNNDWIAVDERVLDDSDDLNFSGGCSPRA